jgi:hypothetical protein
MNNEPQFDREVMKVPSPASDPTAVGAGTKHSSAFGLIIALLFLALVLVLSGLYLWNRELSVPPVVEMPSERPARDENQEPESTTAYAQADAALVMSTSNELPAIEADLAATDLVNLTAEMNAIDAEVASLGTATSTP